ncbi:MAG TPA: hypothetical protein VGL91_00600 [Acidobacteriota bacterium]|jgi:hypothetical protein
MRGFATKKRILGLAVWLISGLTMAFGYLTDQKVYTESDYLTFVPPGVGGVYKDPIFGTDIRRISNALGQHNSDRAGGNLTFIVNEYSTMSPFNNDNSLILLQHQSYFGLYDGTGKYIKDLPLVINASTEPRWSRHDLNVLYFVQGNQFNAYNVATDLLYNLHTFSEYRAISGKGESDICFDGSHFVLVGDNRQVFVYDVSTDRKGPVLDSGGRSFDSVYITPNDNVTITWNNAGSSRYNGIELFDRNMNFLRQLSTVGGHMDVTRDTNGDEVLVLINAADPTPDCDNAVEKIRLSDGHRTCLISLDWSLAVHISAPDNSGWCFVSTYAPSDPDPSRQWPIYTNEILQVKLDGSEVRRIAHHRSRPFNSYNYMPKVSVSRDGDRVVFSSNYGLQSILRYPSEYSDVYMISGLRDAAPTQPAPTPQPAPPPQPIPAGSDATTYLFEYNDPAVHYTGPWFEHNSQVHTGGAAELAMDAGARATFTFTGSAVKWVGFTDEWSGIANVFVDGVLQAVVDTFASPAKAKAQSFSVSNLSAGTHTLVIEVTGARNSNSAGSWIWIDSFEVVASEGGTSSFPGRRRP